MKYIIRGEDGREYGPIDEETLRKWTESGRVVPHTPVRNVLIKKWNKASDLDFLSPAFAVQGTREEKEKNAFKKFSEHLNILFSGAKVKKEVLSPWASSFKNKYLHDPASVSLRISAFAFDLLVIGGFAIFLMLHFSASFKHPEKPVQNEPAVTEDSTASTAQTPETVSAKPSIEKTTLQASLGADNKATAQVTASPTPESIAEVNSAFNRAFYIMFVFLLLYYGLSLGLFAQTFGMWFWGIMLAKTDLGEVLFGRAYLFTVLMIILGAVSPLIVFFNPYKRSLHEILSGTMVIKIAARPKA